MRHVTALAALLAVGPFGYANAAPSDAASAHAASVEIQNNMGDIELGNLKPNYDAITANLEKKFPLLSKNSSYAACRRHADATYDAAISRGGNLSRATESALLRLHVCLDAM